MPSSCRFVGCLVVSGGLLLARWSRLHLSRYEFHEIFIRQHSRYDYVNMSSKDIKYNFIMFYSLFLHNSEPPFCFLSV